MSVKKEQLIIESDAPSSSWGQGGFLLQKIVNHYRVLSQMQSGNKEVTGKDERLDDGSTDIDSLDAFEYTIERDMKYLIEEVEDV